MTANAIIDAITGQTRSEAVQIIGKLVLLYRAAKQPHPKLSNVMRHNHA